MSHLPRHASTLLLFSLLSGCLGQVSVDVDSEDGFPSGGNPDSMLEAPPASQPDAALDGDDGTPSDAGANQPGTEPPQGCGDATETAELGLTNSARADAGLQALACDDLLSAVARAHSQDMCDQGYFSHRGLDGDSFSDRIREAGGSLRTGGENIARGQRTPEAVHASWMNSSGHRANILASQYGRIGIGYVACGGRPYWTQVFTD